jgi:poly(3-hydroxybutyrate) depolymerase
MRLSWLAIALLACGGGTAATPPDDATPPDGTPPNPGGCITDVSAGDHQFTCGGLQVDARIPPVCQAAGCGLILELHGDTGSGLLMDGHTRLRELGAQHGYIVIAPSGPPYGAGQPGSTWHASNDATLVDMVQQFAAVFRIDPKKIHVTGFSRGGFVTWRLLCDHADLFASAAPAGAGDGTAFGEPTCFTPGRAPSRKLPLLFMMGRTDASVGYASMVKIRDAALTSYGTPGPSAPQILAQDASYTHNRWAIGDALIETFDHAYETVADGPFGYARGHCIAGSTTDPHAMQYAIPCKLPNAFVWGEQVMAFFLAHPRP